MTEMLTARTMWDPSPVFAILAFLVMAWKEIVQVYQKMGIIETQ